MKLIKVLNVLALLVISNFALASNWILINVGDVLSPIPNPQVEDLLASSAQSGTTLSVNLGDTSNTEAYYYQRVQIINGQVVNHGWQCQTAEDVESVGNYLVDNNASSGDFTYQVSACMNGNGCDIEAYTSGDLICSTPESTETISFAGEANTDEFSTFSDVERYKTTSEINGSSIGYSHIGVTEGQFRVNESGAATYSLPINVPKGTAGVTPQIALSYNSQGGDGYLGRGWNISGLSSISRCPKTIVQDGHIGGVTNTTNDRLCYNGQRLIKKGHADNKTIGNQTYWDSTEYITEIDSFATFHKINENTFIMETKSGELHFFGSLSDITGSDLLGNDFVSNSWKDITGSNLSSAELTDGLLKNGTTPVSWSLKAIKDIKSNYILFDYIGNDEESYINSIYYTGNLNLNAKPFAEISFNYSENQRPKAGYRVGGKVKLTKLLDSIDVEIDGELYRNYNLG